MSQKKDETLEDFVECLQYNLQRSGHTNVGDDILKIILLREIRYDCLDILNILGKGDISKEKIQDIMELCRRCSRGSSKTKTQNRYVFSRSLKSVNG